MTGHIIEYQKQYRDTNREYVLERKHHKHDCECGGKFTNMHKSRHLRTSKHCRYIESQNNLIQ